MAEADSADSALSTSHLSALDTALLERISLARVRSKGCNVSIAEDILKS